MEINNQVAVVFLNDLCIIKMFFLPFNRLFSPHIFTIVNVKQRLAISNTLLIIWITCTTLIWRKALTSSKGHESMLYGTLLVIVGLLFKFTIVKMRGPNKSLNHLKYEISSDIANFIQTCTSAAVWYWQILLTPLEFHSIFQNEELVREFWNINRSKKYLSC